MISLGMVGGTTAKHAPHLCGVPLGSMAPITPPKKPMPVKEPMGNAPVTPTNFKEPMGNAPVTPPDSMGNAPGTPTKIIQIHPTSGSSGSGYVRVMQVPVPMIQKPVPMVAGPVTMQMPVPMVAGPVTMAMPIGSPMLAPPATLRVPRIIHAPARDTAKAKSTFVIPKIMAAPKAILRTPIPFHKLFYVKHRSPPGSDDYSEL